MTPDPAGRSGRVEAVVHGIVQGVGFRWFVQQTATQLGLVGWAANRADGSVEVVAEGPNDEIEAFVETLRIGPPGALVSQVDVHRQPGRGGLVAFDIRVGAHRGD
jgi:acylphosphatase